MLAKKIQKNCHTEKKQTENILESLASYRNYAGDYDLLESDDIFMPYLWFNSLNAMGLGFNTYRQGEGMDSPYLVASGRSLRVVASGDLSGNIDNAEYA